MKTKTKVSQSEIIMFLVAHYMSKGFTWEYAWRMAKNKLFYNW